MKRTSLDAWIFEKHAIDVADREAFARYQLAALQALFVYARQHSPFYRRLYANVDVPTSFHDFSQLPCTSADDLIRSGPEMLCVRQHQISRIVTLQTSGTSQDPKRVWFTEEDIALTLDFFQNGIKTLTNAHDRALILFPAKTPDSVGALLTTALQRLGLTVWQSTVADAARMTDAIDVVAGPASWVHRLAEATRGATIRAVLTSSEKLTKTMRQQIEEAWGADVFGHYGMTETGLGGAVECAAHDGMHIRENDLYFETIADDGTPLPDGQAGELVVTTLTRKGMPFIRYRTGDRGIISDERCRCGSALRRILHVDRIVSS